MAHSEKIGLDGDISSMEEVQVFGGETAPDKEQLIPPIIKYWERMNKLPDYHKTLGMLRGMGFT